MVFEAGVKKGYSVFCPTCWVDCGKHVITDSDGTFTIPGLNPDLWFTLLAMRDGIVPPTINLENPDVITALDLVPLKAQKREVDVAMSNSFGFGGTNAALIVSKL